MLVCIAMNYKDTTYEKGSVMDEDVIEDIPETMIRFFGCSGKMVRPSVETLKKVLRKVKKGKLVTLGQIQEKLATDFGVERACPASTTKALQKIANESSPLAYWRVIKKNGELIGKCPDGVEGQAILLKKEGFNISHNKNKPIVENYERSLHRII